jgi:hypothetical protein
MDRILWVLAFICFLIAFIEGLIGTTPKPLARLDLVSLGLALAALTFIV